MARTSGSSHQAKPFPPLAYMERKRQAYGQTVCTTCCTAGVPALLAFSVKQRLVAVAQVFISDLRTFGQP